MRKRVLSLLLCLVMLASMVPAVYAEGEVDTAVELGEIVPDEIAPDDGIAASEPQNSMADDGAASPVETDAPGGTTEPTDDAEEPGGTDPSDVGADALGGPTKADGEEAPAENTDAVPAECPVRVVFVCEPVETAITVYDPETLNENGVPVAIEAEADGSFLLLPGTYCYDAAAEGFAPLEAVAFTVEAALSREIRVTLEAAPAPEVDPAADPAEEQEEEADPAEADVGENDEANGAEDEFVDYASGTVVDSGSCGTGVTYTLYSDGELVITGTGAVAERAFQYGNPKTIQRVTIQDGVTGIGNSAFYGCSSLTSVTIPGSVKSIGAYAFANCSSLTDIPIPDSVTSIGTGMFSGCSSLTSITIPNSVTSIELGAFENCSSLTSIAISDSVTSIGKNAFSGCTGLTDISISGSVTSIGDNAFKNCTSLASVTIPDGVQSIGEYAFHGCTSLTAVSFGNGVQSIGKYAFQGITGLVSVSIPASVTSIGDYAFSGCTGLQTLTLTDGLQSIGASAFYNCRKLSAVSLPATVTRLGNSAFEDCVALTEITVPGSVTNVGSAIFYGCVNLRNATLAEGVPQVGTSMFSGCTALKNVTLGSGIASIGGSAFANCTSLVSIRIPASVTSIGSYAFNKAGALQTVTLEEGLQSIGYQAFYMCFALDGIQLPSTLTSIGGSAFGECRRLTSITIPGNVTSIGVAAFRNCDRLQSVTLADGVPMIGDQMFYNCTSLTNVTIGNAVGSIGTQAFYGCNKLPNVLIPPSVTSIGLAAFYNAVSLEAVTLSEGLQTIGYRAFYNCRSLKSIAFPGSVTELRDNAFSENYALKTITFAGDAPSVIQPYTFDGVTANAYYNSNYSGWTDEKRENYGGTLTWIDVGNLFVVSYDANGGTGAPESQIKTRGVSLQLSSVVPTRGDLADGSFTVTFDANGGSTGTASLTAARRQSFAFQNWNTAADGTGVTYASGGSYTADADATLYAQWSTQNVVDAIQLPSATRDGYALAGWSASASATAAEFQPGAMYTPNSDLTLYAVWQSDPVSAFVQRAYSLILEREPDAQGLSDWVNALKNGTVTGATLVNGFVNSPEFLNRGLDNETVATILYRVMLSREPDASGLDLWAGYLNNGMSYTFIVNGFAGSPEFRGICSGYGIDPGFVTLTESRDQNPKVTAFVSRNYRLILQRTPDAGGLNAWTSALLNGTQTGAAVVNGFVLSPEFTSRGLPSDKVVEILYNVMLDRVPDANGKAVWVDYLNQGHSYTDLVNGFAGSAEFQGICADAGITAGWA